jgi:Redoxin
MSKHAMAPEWHTSQWFNSSQPLALSALRGKVVLMHAFQMLCPGCVSHAVPQAERVHRLYAGEGVAVIGLHTVFEHHEAMTPVALAAFLHEYRVTHPIGVDAAGGSDPLPQTMRAYAMQGTPSLMLIDRTGRLRMQQFGLVDDLQLGFALGSLLSEKAGATDRASIDNSTDAATGACTSDGCTP